MQKLLIGILTITTVALGVLCTVQSKQLRASKEQVRATEEARRAENEAREAQSTRVKELERAQVRLEKQIQDFTAVTTALRSNETRQATTVAALSQRVNKAGQAATNGADEKGGGMFGKGMGQMLSTMMKDPSMREMMRDQQSAAVKMMYSGLFKDLNLSPEEKDKLTATLTDLQMKTIESSQLFGDKKEGSTEDGTKSFADAKKQADADIKALLGDDRFKEYQDYQKNIPERMQIDQVKNSLAAQKVPITDQQSSQLFQIMKEEKTAVPPVFPSDVNQDPEKMKSLMTAENIDKQLQWMEDYNARVLSRAGQIFTPEQLKQYQTFQEQQTTMQKLGMKMAREMFGGDKAEPAPATPK